MSFEVSLLLVCIYNKSIIFDLPSTNWDHTKLFEILYAHQPEKIDSILDIII